MSIPFILTPNKKEPAAARLRAMLSDGKVRIVPELYDCLSAKAAEMNGFEVIMVSSGDLACGMTGIPDLQLLSIDDFVRVTEQITRMTQMPLIIDADDGFGLGRALNAQYGCMRIMQAGAAGVLVTDTSELGRKGQLSIPDACLRFSAARAGLDANGMNGFLIARCDSDLVNEFDETVERCRAYIDAGADMLCILWMVSGISLIISGMNMVNFGQGAFYVLGTYLTYTIAAKLGFVPALIVVPILVGFVGFFVEKATRPLFGKNMLYIILLTYGVAYMICDMMVMIWGQSIRLQSLPKALNGGLRLFGIMFPKYYVFVIIVSALIAFAFWFMINKTKLGMLTRAIISDRPMVANLGVNVNRMFSILFMIGIGIAGLGGVLNAPISGLSPKEGLSVFGNVMPILVIGGLRNMDGCLPAALLVGLVNAFGAIFLPQYYNLLPAALMVIAMFINPQGLFTKREAR